MTDFCENFSRIATASDGNRILIARLRCKRWQCEFCATKNRSIWRAKIIRSIANHECRDWHFVTLTAHQETRGFNPSLANLRAGWQKLNSRMRRAYPPFDYVRVMELHKDDSCHWHLLMSVPFHDIVIGDDGVPYSRWLKDNAAQSGMGYRVGVDYIDGHAGMAAAYVTKYVSKGIADVLAKAPGRVRVIQTSQNFIADDYEPPVKYDWQVRLPIPDRELAAWWGRGIQVVDVSTGQVVDSDALIMSSHYPPLKDSQKL